ncbi:MAG: IS4 family transposase [Candidatus Omnitrophica bacterium CG12_big_fil_rev_8_21_14_0_65_43_15]|uniref:IS4 family transposase n=1 Tax=Candidatus Taenaricola geysiri TaxID=1974752 RepID=A0A2J0LMV7_9BACT|nr:MAG: IS4 family transposase [Candidatus Omnitrophica bacterium CG12_big_fil_rev_8_21_14_0_65_43_15]
MSHYNTVLNQMLQLIPRHQFETAVKSYAGDRYVKRFNCWNQLTTLLYAQASGKESLREIEQSLSVNDSRLYHLGLPAIKRSTLADANQTRSYKIFESLFYKMLKRCQDLTPKHKFKFKNPLYSIDATVIDLCLSMFSWAKFMATKGGIKLHYEFNHSGQIPSFLVVTDAKQYETTVVKKFFPIIADSIYCLDRGYNDFVLYRRINEAKAFFVTRARDNLDYTIIGQHTQTLKKNILSDEQIKLANKKYPKPLRLIRYLDKETDEIVTFLTNNFILAPYSITQVYKARWQIEIFFKWIKQNLKIKTFLGTSKNAVLTQIWTAMCYYMLLAYVKYQTKYRNSLFYLHRIIKETLLARLTLIDLLRATPAKLNQFKTNEFQLAFW